MLCKTAAAAFTALLPIVLAQTSTECDPTKTSCPPDTGLNSQGYTADFTKGSNANVSWSAAAYTTIKYGSSGAEFVITNSDQAPTIQTDFFFLFGRVDVKLKAAPGQGIVSSIVLESDDLDEIDWEFLGGDTTQCETNFFGKGNTTSYDRAVYYNVQSPQTLFHTYSIDWDAQRIQWIIDGVVVRTLTADDPFTNGGQNYPQTPMRLRLGNWAGGGPGEPKGTVEWAGGATDFTQGPFTMYVDSVTIQNKNPACMYTYSDQTGNWKSIKSSMSGCKDGSSLVSPSESNATASSTAAPTLSMPVNAITVQNSGAVVTHTNIGSSYSTDATFVSAENFNATATGGGYPASATTKPSSTAVQTGSNVTGPSSRPSGSSLTSEASAVSAFAVYVWSVALAVLTL